jgi:hypothetical protein
MKLRSRPVLVAGLAVLVLAAGGAAYATVNQSEDTSTNETAAGSAIGDRDSGLGERREGRPLYAGAVTRYLGLTVEQVLTRLGNGSSLADIAKAEGKSVDGLKQAIIDGVTAELSKGVGAGTVTEQQKQRMLEFVRANVDELVNSEGGPHGGRRGDGPGFGDDDFGPDGRDGPPFAPAVASYLGLTQDQVLTRLRGGSSLADIAKAEGKSVEGLTKAIVDGVEKELSKSVAAGNLTEQQKQRMLEFIRANVDDFVNGNLPGPGSHRGGFGPDDDDGPGDAGPDNDSSAPADFT